MSFISKEHFSMALKSIKKLLSQKVDKSELQEEILNMSQPNWNETDETSKAYILNKPFDAKEIEYVFLDLNSAPTSGQTAVLLTDKAEYKFIPGERYTVIINGVSRAVECVTGQDYGLCLILDSGGNPSYGSIYQSMSSNEIYAFSNWPYGASVKVIGKVVEGKKLDAGYISDKIARKVDLRNMFYGTCTTAETRSDKTAAVNSYGNLQFSLKYGNIICVQFKYGNQNTSFTLNVNGTGAKPVKLANKTSDAYLTYWRAYTYITFFYDGSSWNIISMQPTTASTNYYGYTKLSNSYNSTSTSLAATPSAVKAAYDLANAALPKSGGTMTGNLTLAGNPTSSLHAATKAYVDNKIVQSDWNQNDETALDYIKNKPFCDEYATTLFDGDITLDWMGPEVGRDYFYEFPSGLSLVDGTTYTVKCNGKSMSAVCQNGLIWFDHPSIPFGESADVHIDSRYLSVNYPDLTSFHLWIGVINTAFKAIDEKFIPDTIARKSDIPGAVIKSQIATVGQTIVVSKVDSDGKPVEWEYVDPQVLIDQNTSTKYRLSVVDGKLTMDIVESEV